MKPKTLFVLEQALEEGINLGLQRAYKNTDTPSEEQVKAAIFVELKQSFFQYFSFDNDEF